MPSKPAAISSSLHPAYMRLLYVHLRERGVDADAAIAEAGMDWQSLASDPRALDVASFARFAQIAQQRLQCPWLGLEVGGLGQVSIHGAVGHAAISSANLRQLLQTIAQYGPLRSDSFVFRLLETPCEAHFVIEEVHALGEERQFILEAVLATMLRVIETALGKVCHEVKLSLPFAEPAWAARYQDFGFAQINFSSPQFALVFERKLLDLPCLTADADAHAAASRECARALNAIASAPYTQRVQMALQAHTSAQLPELSQLAQQLHLSNRTLMRKLKQEGSSFQALLDERRKAAALEHLSASSASIEQIAERLGYLDTSNFSRTFRRWFGITPSQYRQQHHNHER